VRSVPVPSFPVFVVLFVNEAQARPGPIRSRIQAIRTRHPKFSIALVGALGIALFSILGEALTASPAEVRTAAIMTAPAAAPVRSLLPLAVAPAPSASPRKPKPKGPDHVVIVVEENESQAMPATDVPYLASLERHGANFTHAYAETHPSQPNYLALFSGSTHGVTTDACPQPFHSANLASQITGAGRTFAGYAESLPSPGYTGCRSGTFARKHTPWMDFTNVPAAATRPFGRFPQRNFASLPTISFVVPNLCNAMHDCPVAAGDAWLQANLGAYAAWAKTHNSLLIVVFDEADAAAATNRIPLVVYGQHVKTGTYRTRVDHYSVLRTIEDLYGLPCLGQACTAKPLTAAFSRA
jgi:phosphatidylinositol-3-phosphatase